MCGRYVLYGPEEAILEGFSLQELPPFGPRYNVAPSTPVLAIRTDRRARRRVAETMRWGLVPHWAKDPSIGARLINARAETIATKPAFRDAFRRGRCVIPANGFYEWKTIDAPGRRRRQPYYVHRADGGLIAMAGLYDRHDGPEGPVRTCCIVTTKANAVAAQTHDRMPVLLDRDGVDRWLDPDAQPDALQALLEPCPDDWLALRMVAPAVGDPRNEGAALIEPWQALA
ncbi:MAG TPA: SOS response-associated peptidase [Zeimonas sp.]|nr:SOS response-associated peptidase [Zeimonas sp.]